MPFKANVDRRHRIPKLRHRVTNWAGYDAALRARQPDRLMWTAGARQRISARLDAPIDLTWHGVATAKLREAPRVRGLGGIEARSALVKGPVSRALMSGLSSDARR